MFTSQLAARRQVPRLLRMTLSEYLFTPDTIRCQSPAAATVTHYFKMYTDPPTYRVMGHANCLVSVPWCVTMHPCVVRKTLVMECSFASCLCLARFTGEEYPMAMKVWLLVDLAHRWPSLAAAVPFSSLQLVHYPVFIASSHSQTFFIVNANTVATRPSSVAAAQVMMRQKEVVLASRTTERVTRQRLARQIARSRNPGYTRAQSQARARARARARAKARLSP